MDLLPTEQFLAYVRHDLNHLYEPNTLRRSPLAELFQVAGQVDAAERLKNILLAAVEGLKPDEDEPSQSRAWRIYDLLYFRYVLGYDRDRVANQLGFSPRQLSREQLTAIETLALRLWKTRPAAAVAPNQPAPSAPPAWLKDLPPEKYVDLSVTLQAVLDLVRPLARQWQVELIAPQPALPAGLILPHYALRHALLNLLGVCIPWAGGASLQITVEAYDQSARVGLLCSREQLGPLELGPKENHSLEIARTLIAQKNGMLELSVAPQSLSAALTLPVMEQLPVLVIDDNPDLLDLFRRYVQGTRYVILSALNPTAALQLAEKSPPRAIILDVMMPETDGWDVLMRLRENPRTSGLPVAICTILPQESLALSLGANAFLQKPVLPEDFIAVLDRLVS